MLSQTIFLFCIGLLSVSSKLPNFTTRSGNLPKSANVYAKLQARIVPDSTTPTPTRTARRSVRPASHHTSKRATYSITRVYAVLQQCLGKVHPEVANIGQASTASQSPDQAIPVISDALRKILDAVRTALADIKNCESGPVPSGSYDTPPTLPDLCRRIIELITCLASILPTMAKTLKASTVHDNFGDIISQITDTVSQIISAIDSRFPGAISTLSQLGQDLWKAIQFNGFGFSAITNLVKPL